MQTLSANEISVVSGGEPGPVIVIPAGFWYQFKEPGMSMEEIAAEWEFEHNGMCGP